MSRLTRLAGALLVACALLMGGMLTIARAGLDGLGCLVRQDSQGTYLLDLATGSVHKTPVLYPAGLALSTDHLSVAFNNDASTAYSAYRQGRAVLLIAVDRRTGQRSMVD